MVKKDDRFTITSTVQHEPEVKFWDGFHFEIGKKKIAMVKISLVSESGKKISFSKYLSAKKLTFGQGVSNIGSAISTISIEHPRDEMKARKLVLLGRERATEFARILTRNQDKFRGMAEGTVIVCDDNTYIVASGNAGYVPSVPTQRIVYPNAIYRDGDLCDILVDQGAPEIVNEYTQGEKAHPTKFKVVKKSPLGHISECWFAIEYQTAKQKVKKSKICDEPPGSALRPRFGLFG